MGILAYIWLRFEWQFALGGVLALLHDVVITVGIFAVFQLKFDLTIVAALLTILGYSINDTVVVFDRLRENLMKYKTMPLKEVMNLSVNETLSRTLATSFTTLLAVGSMLALGGDVIRGFSFAIFMGIILGTYSSVYVAKNLVLFLGLDRSDKPKKTGKGADHEFADGVAYRTAVFIHHISRHSRTSRRERRWLQRLDGIAHHNAARNFRAA